MRTTVNIDDDILELAHEFARSRSLTLGKAISELARQGVAAQRPVRLVNGVYVVDLPASSPKVTTRRVGDLEADEV